MFILIRGTNQVFSAQIESALGVQNINQLLDFKEVDGVMIGPDLVGSWCPWTN